MRTLVVKRITITMRGDDEHECELALDEVVRLLREGYTSGHNSNDTSAFYFDTTENIKKGEYPA